MSILAISVRRPWAWAIFDLPDLLWKCIENRDWRTEYRGPVLIHVSRTCTNTEYNEAVFAILRATAELGRTSLPVIPPLLRMQHGGIVGAVDITDCFEDGLHPWRNHMRYGFKLTNRRKCPFVACRGQERFFRPSNEVLEQLRINR